MRRTIVEQIMVPELPNVLAKEQYMLYAPIANSDYPGMVKLGNIADPNYLLTLDDGVLNVKSKVNITAVHLNTILTSDDLGKITFTKADGSTMTATGGLAQFIRDADDAHKNIIRGITIDGTEDSSTLGTVTFTKNDEDVDPIILSNVFAPVFNSIVKNVSIDQRVNITEENKVDDEEPGPNPNVGNVTFERWGEDIILRNVFEDVFRDRITSASLTDDGELCISRAGNEDMIVGKVVPIRGDDYFTELDIIDIAHQVERLSTDVYKQGGYYETVDGEDIFRYNNSASIAGASREIAAGSMAVGPGARTFTEGSVAFGRNAMAGSRAYYITAIRRNDIGEDGIYRGAIALSRVAPENRFENVDASDYIEDFETGYAVGDEFCVINNTHYAFCGRIESINKNIIFYETVITYYKDDEAFDLILPNDNFAKANEGGKRDNWRDCVLWVPSKPQCGVTITNGLEGEDFDSLFNTAYAFGDYSYATADDAFASGDNVFMGGNHGVVFGVLNRGAYGNIVAGRASVSTGVHSALLGRELVNVGSYNALFNRQNKTLGNYCILGGLGNEDSGSRNIGSGDRNKNSGNDNIYSGSLNVIGASKVIVVATNSFAAESSHIAIVGYNSSTSLSADPGPSLRAGTTLRWVTYPSTLPASGGACDCTINIGNSNLVRHKQCGVVGRHLISGAHYQFVVGRSNSIDSGALFIVGNGNDAGTTVKNCFTIGASGPRASVGTDGVTVAFMTSQLLNGKW